jgi:hypothetical protein
MPRELDTLILEEVIALHDEVDRLKREVNALVSEVVGLRQFLDRASQPRKTELRVEH